ncbi:hypothetical protein PYCCODRAFT_1432477 [Trametes coccinea BRFM310]|uniref:Uncharacterized protein n=1 Tax=Trametes coccinea (strain BRFM310) TaxID=1353009 RepID=A0A1Y2IYM7_TRAC3|nr:hypothetical protein PYCCODRAFT_1432477 [Trametes coccinea BRFM310]
MRLLLCYSAAASSPPSFALASALRSSSSHRTFGGRSHPSRRLHLHHLPLSVPSRPISDLHAPSHPHRLPNHLNASIATPSSMAQSTSTSSAHRHCRIAHP